MRITELNRKRIEVKSVPTPRAQFDSLCHVNSKEMVELSNVLSLITSHNSQRLMERVLMDLMLSGGLRISEVLDLYDLRVNLLGQVFIFGRKGSDSKLVTPIYFKEFWLKRIPVCRNPFHNISRFSFYKWLKSNDVCLTRQGCKNNSVTHIFRHLHVYLMELMNLESKQMSEILGHKGNSSLKYYLHGK